MEKSDNEGTDGASIRPVSSLRSHFESMMSSKPNTAVSRDGSPMLKSQRDNLKEPTGRMSLDLPTRDNSWNVEERKDVKKDERREGRRDEVANRSLRPPPAEHSPGRMSPGTWSRQRPVSMMGPSPPISPPAVTIDSPRSPPRGKMTTPSHPSNHLHAHHRSPSSGPGTPSSVQLSDHHFKIPTKPPTPHVDPRKSPFLSASEALELPGNLTPLSRDGPSHSRAPSAPPPVNRADKPKIPAKPTISNTDRRSPSALAPIPSPADDKISPFSTPPSSSDSSDARDSPAANQRTSAPKSKTVSTQYLAGNSNFEPPPVHHTVVAKRQSHVPSKAANGQDPGRSIAKLDFQGPRSDDVEERRPGLPPRRDPVANERMSSPSHASTPRRPPIQAVKDPMPSAGLHYPPPPKRSYTAEAVRSELPEPRSRTMTPKPEAQSSRQTPRLISLNATSDSKQYADSSDDAISAPPAKGPSLTDYPDSSRANRRQPCFNRGVREISTKDARLLAVCGEYVCTSGHLTRAWDLTTGDVAMSLLHGETIKVTCVAFKPATSLEEEGTRLWLGTNFGEIQEVDIPTQSVVVSKTSAHPRREIIKIHRHGNEMWTLDDEGKLHVWPPDESGSPNLKYSHHSYRVPRGHSFSLVAGDHLWLATGKDIRVFQPSTDPGVQFQVLARTLSQPGAADVTSGAVIGNFADRIYFGHSDGKVTIYSRHDYACLGIVNVSLYKISSLAGVGDYLWAGFNTGMIYVYDTRTTPWTVKKDWQAHESPVLQIVVDRTSIWKLDRLQVASMGVDNYVRIWDGMLEEDWLETEIQRHDVEYCQFREISALVTTWNAGASIPSSMRNDEMSDSFFRELFGGAEPPDIMVFGFQELVDLEDKKVTAKSLFKSSKKKDPTEQEHMSRQYRAWRDHLTRCIEQHMPTDVPFHLLHTANLVGLFSCIFVKESLRKSIRQVATSEVKRGMGGLHGNKGALIVRFVLDDSSLCFVNCHLAAGQTQTTNRNNDIAGILETAALPEERDPAQRIDTFIGGGDGTMILDHEICVLNGDLNYRIDTMTRDTVINAVRNQNLTKLLERDQLLLSRRRNPGFRLRAFTEGPITFAPTYKYDVGTDKYDTSDKKRAPAWCDRILYRGVGRIKLLDYRRHEVRVSDHRPVSASFKMRIKTISPRKRAQIWERCERDFAAVKWQLAHEAKLDFLVNVCGFRENDSRKLLDQSDSDRAQNGLSDRARLSGIVETLRGNLQ
ncbi:MAG: hypothetical protein M4579_001523 [Chaenotheca gracillima]|nr:MAG: hypothetical protein M4579_001523 [Chaenotheca gracillima]